MRELRERAGQLVKALCLILAAVLVYQLASMVIRWNPFRGVTVPELPVLTSATNNPVEGSHKTNQVAATMGKGTNNSSHLFGNTNALPRQGAAGGTNSPSHQPSTNASLPLVVAGTNAVTNSVSSATPAAKGTNLAVQAEAAALGTNATANPAATNITITNMAAITSTNGVTNVVARVDTKTNGTNPIPSLLSTNLGTNLAISVAAVDTNNPSTKPRRHNAGGGPMPEMAGMNFNPGQMPGRHAVDLPPALQARIRQITESEVLAPVMHPLPMALLGIAGEVAFLRSANGQTGLVKEGDSLDDIKLLRIGINRVLIEQDGQKKELMIFSGYGGESLLPNDTTNETNHAK